MNTFTNPSSPLKFFGAVLALALIAVAALMVAPTSAQSPPNLYGNPQPCGPGAETAFQPEPHEIHAGHFALFDAYWQWTSNEDLDNTGVLHTNTCPPLVTTEPDPDDDNGGTITTLTASGIDIDEAIIHVKDQHKAAVVTSASASPSGTEIVRDEYEDLDRYTVAGDEVWWLRLDDPDTTDVDETSDLTLGFSTKRFDKQYWHAADGNPPLRYTFKLERYKGSAASEHPHFLAYRASPAGTEAAELIWDSALADTEALMMEPGYTIENLQWVFTKAGTYAISVQLQGWVRQARPDGAGRDWLPISSKVTETSEVKRYVIQVGTQLDENEPPRFGYRYTIDENSPAGTIVGQPTIQVITEDHRDLEFSLSGAGAGHFVLDTASAPGMVQIKVAEGANLDFETKHIYELLLNVTDNLDHESNPDPTVDHFIAVQIQLHDIEPTISLGVSNHTPSLGEAVTFTAVVHNFEEIVGEYSYELDGDVDGGSGQLSSNNAVIYTVAHNSYHAEGFQLWITYSSSGTLNSERTINSEKVFVTWQN